MLDTALAINDAVGMLILAGMGNVKSRAPEMFGMGVGAVIFTASAAYGYSNTSECLENRIVDDDPDIRQSHQKKAKPPVWLQPEPGVMRSN